MRHIDAQLDQLQLLRGLSTRSSPALQHASLSTEQRQQERAEVPRDALSIGDGQNDERDTRILRAQNIQTIIKALSTSSSSQATVSRTKLHSVLKDLRQRLENSNEGLHASDGDLQWLEWCAVGKAAAQTYGLVLGTVLDEISPLSTDIWYWDDILSSYAYSSLFTIQISPLRIWAWSRDVYQDARDRLQLVVSGEAQVYPSVTERWRRFYGLVRESIHDRSITHLQSKFMSPLTEARVEARIKQKNLKKLRDLSASALGMLVDEGFTFEVDDPEATVEHIWQQNLSRSIILMDAVLQRLASTPEISTHDIEEQSFNHVDEYVDQEGTNWSRPPALATCLLNIISVGLPNYQSTMRVQVKENGKPSRLIRYWLPATALLLSSSTLLRIFLHRRQAILAWIFDLGTTCKDFWYNWIVDPIKNLIGTIRHDEKSEIALMSKESLKGDRESLERMVVDFAVDNSSAEGGRPLHAGEIADIRNKVHEGDLTPVLRTYEKDLQRPFFGAVKGELIRALLIQIQKTKVDVEVAIGGIDALLKSQELVFGFVGLTPSLLVCVALSRWLLQVLGSNRRSQHRQQGQMNRTLRNIDRILTLSRPTANQTIPYKDRGLLLCEVHGLRQLGQSVMPASVQRDFVEDLNDLVESHSGVAGQLKIIERIRWTYGRYMQ